MLNEFEAAAYVMKMEAEWYGAASPIARIEPNKECEGALDVQTEQNFWTVWIESYVGTEPFIYGEC